MTNHQRYPTRLLIIIVTLLMFITACSPQNPDGTLTDDEARTILIEAVDNFRLLQAFRFDIEQGGTPYLFSFQLGPGQAPFNTSMSTAEAAFIAPDKLWANAQISLRSLLVNVSLFAEGETQWLSPLTSPWIPFTFAEGFDPSTLMGEDSGFTSAITDVTNVTYVETIQRDETDIVHIQGNATADVVNTLLFGLVNLEADVTDIDVFIDTTNNLPIRLVLTVPDTASNGEDDTFWRIDIFDANVQPVIDPPRDVDITMNPVDTSAIVTVPDWITPLLWILGLSAILGAVVTPFVYQRKGRSVANAIVIGGVVGALGSLLLLIPLWLFIPQMTASDEEPKSSIDYTQQLKNINPWVVM
ncbi:MAG: LppX_LprAFG lipoprotein, partial [Chloroflexota bacterium]